MSTQADFEKINNYIIEPMKRHWNADFDTAMVDDYVKDLGKYTQQQLTEAMSELRQTAKRRPTIAHIVEAIQVTNAKTKSNGPRTGYAEMVAEHEKKDRRATVAAQEYADTFKHDRMAEFDADTQKRIRYYIREAAYLQAQILEQIRNRGWSCEVAGMNNERTKWFIEMNHRNCKGGFINVEVPWKWFEKTETKAA